MIRTATCIVINCDDCQDDYWMDADFEGIPHWETVEDAREEREGEDGHHWWFGPDGATVCGRCVDARVDTDRELLTEPVPYRCDGQITIPLDTPTGSPAGEPAPIGGRR